MSRAEIFNRIRTGLKVGTDDSARRAAVEARLNARAPNLIPQRAQKPPQELVSLFLQMAREAAAEVIEIEHRAQLAGAVEHYLQEQGIGQLVSSEEELISSLQWSHDSGIVHETRPARVGDEASLTGSFAGIAETGTLLLYSGAEKPTTLNFLPDTHIVVLSASTIVGPYEDAWKQLRQATGGQMPRTVNLITGPSRSADIEQRLQMGAHGPRNLVIVLMHEE